MIIIGAATYLPHIGERIAVRTGLNQSFVGSLLIAISTSLPELVVSAAALKLGAVDLVIGNLLGSNLFNIAILAIDDILYTKGPLLSLVSPSHALTAEAALAMTAIAVISLTYRSAKRFHFLDFGSLAILVTYLVATVVLYLNG